MIEIKHGPINLNTYYGSKRTHSIQECAFDSVDDVTNHPKNGAVRTAFSSHYGDASFAKRWYGVRSKEELDEAVRTGWPQAREAMLSNLKSIELPESMTRPELARRRRRTKGDFGNEVDIHAVRAGRMDRAWDRTVKVQQEQLGNRLVHLCVKTGSSGTITHDQALWRGAVTLRIYEALVHMGKSVAISVFDMGCGGLVNGGTWMTSCKVKDYGQPLDEGKLAALVTVGFARHYLMEVGAHCGTIDCTTGYGSDTDDYRVIPHAAKEEEERGGTVVLIGNCYSEYQCELVIRKFVKQFTFGEKVEGMTTAEWRASIEAGTYW